MHELYENLFSHDIAQLSNHCTKISVPPVFHGARECVFIVVKRVDFQAHLDPRPSGLFEGAQKVE